MTGNEEAPLMDPLTTRRPEAGGAGRTEEPVPRPGVRYETRGDGLGFLIFDRPDEKVNVLNASLFAVLELILDQAAPD